MVSVHAWTSFLPDRHLHLFGCSRASAYQCSVRPGLVHGKFKNQTRFRYQLPSLHSQTCFSALCELNTQTLNYLKKKKIPFPTIFSWQIWESIWNLLKNGSTWKAAVTHWDLSQEMLCTLSCHGGFADASAAVRYKTGITTFPELNKLLKNCSSHPPHFLILLETHCIVNLFSGTVPPGFQWGLFAQRMQRGCEL